MALQPTLIEVPGKGIVDLSALKVDEAVKRYDRNLRFGWNPENQDYILYIAMPRDFDSAYVIEGEPVYPIMGFGHQIPTVDHVLGRLAAADTRKRGLDILHALNKHNAELKRAGDTVASAQVGQAAERIEHLSRKLGQVEKYAKVSMHVPKSRNAS